MGVGSWPQFLIKFKTNIFIYEYFPKNHLEINSTQTFYPILTPNISKVKIFILFVGVCKKIFLIKENFKLLPSDNIDFWEKYITLFTSKWDTIVGGEGANIHQVFIFVRIGTPYRGDGHYNLKYP